MNRILTFLLFLAAVGLVVFFTVIEPRLESTREEKMREGYVLNFSFDDVRSISIVEGDESLEINREGEGWRMSSRMKDQVASDAVYQLLNAAQNLRILDVIRYGEMNDEMKHKHFGLSTPRRLLDFKGDGEAELWFGKDAPGENQIYVRRADSQDVYVVSDELQRLAFRPVVEFRDRRLTPLHAGRVDRLVLRRGSNEIELQKSPTGWHLVRPLHAPADVEKVQKFLEPILGAAILDFLDEETPALATLSASELTGEILVYPSGSDEPQVLRIGKAVEGDKVEAYYAPRNLSCHLPSTLLSAFEVKPDDLRDRKLVSVNFDIIDRISLRLRGQAYEIIRSGADTWKLVQGDQTQDFPDALAQKLVQALSRSEVRHFVPATEGDLQKVGLGDPELVIGLDSYLSENTPETAAGRYPIVQIRLSRGPSGEVYAQMGDQPEICVLPAAGLEWLFAAPSSWENSQPASFSTP